MEVMVVEDKVVADTEPRPNITQYTRKLKRVSPWENKAELGHCQARVRV